MKAGCAKWYTYTNCNQDGDCWTETTCDKWNYRTVCYWIYN